MNTKKLFFGFLAVAYFAMAAVSTTVLVQEDLSTQSAIDKDKIKKPR